MKFNLKALISIILYPFRAIFFPVISFFRASKTARILLLIVLIKFTIFYGFFKSFLFPRYLKPKWESEQHRIDEVTKVMTKETKTQNND